MSRWLRKISPMVPLPLKDIYRKLIRPYVNPRWYRSGVGGMWREMGDLQFRFLVDQGLRSDQFLLDVGCGSLRGGLHFIRYLEPGHYCGVDKDLMLLRAGKDHELLPSGLKAKEPRLVHLENFEFSRLNTKFHFALAQSVFTHISLNHIVLCLQEVEKVLHTGGRFFATFFENPMGLNHADPIQQYPGVITYYDRDPFYYHFSVFQKVCKGTSLLPEYIGSWAHPVNQKMMVFRKI